MQNFILLILLAVIVAIVVAQILRIQNHAEKKLLIGLILGLLAALGYYKWRQIDTQSHEVVNEYYNFDLGDICKKACASDDPKPDEKKDDTPPIRQPQYTDDGLYDSFPNDFTFDQQKFGDMDVPDGWLRQVKNLKVSDNKYDIDGHLINGNCVAPGSSPYNDEYWKLQEVGKKHGDDPYTAANLHMSRKPREQFLYNSRWGKNSLQPWIEAELENAENSCWYEQNQDLDQYF